MVEVGSLANKVFALLKGNGLQIKLYDDVGSETTDPEAARRFFVSEPNLMITIDEDGSGIEFSKGNSVGNETSQLQKNIRKLADEFLMNFTIKVFGKSIQPRDYSYQAKNKMSAVNEAEKKDSDFKPGLPGIKTPEKKPDFVQGLPGVNQVPKKKYDNTNATDVTYRDVPMEQLRESFSRMFGSKRTSQQTLENVRILVKHKAPVNEEVRGARTRQISAIFLECNGERFRFPHNHLTGARAMAQHMAHGGTINDKVGGYIVESTGQLLKLQSFNRYVTTNKLINEDSSGIVETVKENIETLRTELKKLTGSKTYETVKARIETFERQQLDEDDVSQLKDLFTIRRFDEKFEEVLPIVKQLIQEKDTYLKRIEESAVMSVLVRREMINTVPMFEFASENARLGFKLNELALRIVENDELAAFVNKVGTKLCKEGVVNDFEKAVISQVLENVQIVDETAKEQKELTECVDLDTFYDRFDSKFY